MVKITEKKFFLPLVTFVAGIILALVYVSFFGPPLRNQGMKSEAAGCPFGYSNLGSLTNIHTGERSTVCEHFITGSVILVKEATAKGGVEAGIDLQAE